MQAEKFIVREPLVNPQERALGYEIAWQGSRATDAGRDDADILFLAGFVAQQLNESDSGALLGDQVIFIEAKPALLAHESICALPPKGTILVLRGGDLLDDGAGDAIRSARQRGYGISVRDVDISLLDRAVLGCLTHIEIAVDSPDFPAQVQQFRALNSLSIRLVARRVDNWQAYDVCKKLDLLAFVGNLHLTPRPGQHARELNPAQSLILQLMDMVRQNADVKQLESVLKRDAALSYKLLRYINSAGFGLGCEIQSLKHAVTMLGYSPLYRWLALLLATATTTGYSPVLMHAAIVRGRFAELLGSTFLPRQEAENLFVAGMFSLLDKLLGVPMEDVLEKIQLSESVTQALLSREGIYGPFLALAEACELHSKAVEDMAASLCIDARQVNQAQLSALAWAQRITL
ncbi:HDOD domain-containing protein [Noviherbaspirillum sp. CPCC 100848]|uniref:HDOD domain-containing protein n=1 Tax=Noviherbaspirillum album TaxID=3080276 RepID=A0ABU6JD55_9BURK|nr:HDOD domain-containing protein [Noviherbaspirillum sp. CPCC 100848]MEC4721386.1 HDOD domain-containing protein [Noviherbaspirillum sp. CPCC 100848]